MSFLDRIFHKKKEKEPEEAKVTLKDAEKFISDKMKNDFEAIKEALEKEYESLQSVAKNMQDQLKTLEQASYPERTYPIVISKSVGSRKSFINKMNILLEQIKKPMGEDMISVLNFYNETDKLINVTNMETTKEYAYLKLLFEKEGKDIVQSFRQMIEIKDRLGLMLKKFNEYDLKLPKLKEDISEISKLTEELKRNYIDDLDKKLKEVEDYIKKNQNELYELTQGNEWKNLLDLQKTLEDLKIRMQNKKSDFAECISKLEVPLKKYKWSVENKTLDDYIRKSFDSILYEDPKGEVLVSALKDIKIKVIEGEMDLKDSDKFMAVLEDVKENNIIGKIFEDYSRLSKELKTLEERILLQEVSKRKIRLEYEIKKSKRDIEDVMNDKKRTEGIMKGMQENKEQRINELEDLLNDFSGKKISIQLN